MKKLNTNSILDKFINFVILNTVALIPIFFLPITTEFYDFNKQAFLVLSTALILIALIAKIIFSKSLTVKRSVVDFPMVIFFIVGIVSTFLSISVSDSIFGSTGRWFPSLIGLSVLGIYYYLVSSSQQTNSSLRSILFALIISSSVNSVVTTLSYFQIYLGSATFLKNPNFTLTGSTTSSIFLSVIAFILSLGLFTHSKNIKSKIAFLVASIVNLLPIIIINSFLGFVLLAISLLTFLFVIRTDYIKNNRFAIFGVIALIVILGSVKNVPLLSSYLSNSNFPYEITLPIKYSWAIATSVLRESPFLGTGPSTFYLDFTMYKPQNINSSNLWNIRFDKPNSEFINIIVEFGILGFLSILLLARSVFILVKSSMVSEESETLSRVIAVAVVTSLFVFILTYATVLNSFVFILLLALLVSSLSIQKYVTKKVKITSVNLTQIKKSLNSNGDESEKITHSPIKFIFATPLAIIIVGLLYLTSRNYLAEFYTRMSINSASSNNWDKVYKLQEMAILASPTRDDLYNRHAQTILILANSIASKEDINDEDRQAIQNLIAQAINVSKVGAESVNTLNVRNWETRAIIFRNIFQAAENAAEWAIASYNIAIQLDPTNPRLRLELGGIYYATQDYLSAASQFRQAITLKADYANAYYNFAQSLYLLGDFANAKTALETTLSLIPQDSEDAKVVQSEIDLVSKQIASSNTQQTESESKPTVEQLQASPEPEIIQEPISNIGDTQPEFTQDITEEVLTN